jgi:hypothetical protein
MQERKAGRSLPSRVMQRIRRSVGVSGPADDRALRRRWFHHARARRSGYVRALTAVACALHTAKGYALRLAKQVLSGRLDSVIKTIEDNIRLV